MLNYGISGSDKLVSRGVPFHAINLACNPFDIERIATKFGIAGNWKNMVKRIVKAKDDFLARISATVVLVFKFLTNKFGVLGCLQAIGRCLFEITTLAKRPVFSFHRWQHRVFTADGTDSITDAFFSPCFSRSSYNLRAGFTGSIFRTRWNLTAISTQVGSNQAIASVQIMPAMARFIFLSILTPLAGLSVSSLGFACSLLLFVYNGISHVIRSLIVNYLVRPAWQLSPAGGSIALYHNSTNACKYRQIGDL